MERDRDRSRMPSHADARAPLENGPARGQRSAVTGELADVDAALQMKRQSAGGNQATTQAVHRVAQSGFKGSSGRLPHLNRIQASFGSHDVSQVQAYIAPEATRGLGARAYASGDKVAFDGSPGLHTAAHEAAHVVQQRGGVQLSAGIGRSGDRYERHADAVADAVLRGESAQVLLDEHASPRAPSERSGRDPSVQREESQQAGPELSRQAGGRARGQARALGGRMVSAVDQALAQGASDGEVASFLDEIGAALGQGGAAHGDAGADVQQDEAQQAVQQQPLQFEDTPGDVARDDGASPSRGGHTIGFPHVGMVDGWRAQVLTAGLFAIPSVGPLLGAAVLATNQFNVTVGIGPNLGAGLGIGGGGSAGIVITAGGRMGFYGSLSGACGAIASASATLAVTVVDGGIDRFSGTCIAITAAGGEVVVGGASILLTTDGDFLGITVQAGVGVGSPFEVYVEAQRTWTTMD